ncbi:MAG: PAS domain S-box protein, partial [Bacteroidota bacterium]|nr:PAS domain S-box protein [Bacteroidota bacterium]
ALYASEGEFDKAYQMHKLFKNMSDSIRNEKNIKERARIELQYEFEKQQKEKDIIAGKKSDRQSFLLYVLIAALVIVLLFISLTARIYFIKRRANRDLSEKNKIIQKSYDDVKLLSEIGKNITTKLNSKDIITTVYDNLRSLMDTDVFALGLYNSGKNQLDFHGAVEKGKCLPYFNYDLSNSNHLASLCFNSQQEITIYNYLEESKKYLKKTPEPRAGGMVGSMIYLPLNFRKNKIGVITVQSLRTNAYCDFDVNYLQNLAAYIAIALENANTYLQLEVQNKFNILLKSTIPNPVYYKDTNGIYRDCNPAFLKFVGKTHNEVIGHTVFDVVPFDVAYTYKTKDEELFRERKIQIYESKYKTRNGEIRDIKLYKDVLRNEDGEVIGILGVIHDITDFKQTEQQLLVFKELAEASGQGFCIADHEKKIFYVNPTLHEMINEGSGDKLEGRKIGLSFPGNMQKRLYDEIFPELLKSGYWTGELERISRGGKHIFTIEDFFIIRSTKGNGHFIANISTDISHQKKTENTLKESQRELSQINKTKDRFFSIISHDLRSPFNSILGFADLLLSNFDHLSDKEKKLYVRQINETAGLTYSMIENLLTWHRAQSGQMIVEPEVIDLNKLIDEIVLISDFQSKAKRIEVISKIVPGTSIIADRNITSTVLRNLLTNAIKFTPQKGEITISALEQNDNIINICVEDTGIGISESDQPKLFNIDEKHTLPGTNNETGTGMGLKLCKQLVELNNGKLWFESKLGKGSKFFFSVISNS